MSAQPDHTPAPLHAPAPGAPAELLARLRSSDRAERWVPAFEREWAAALEESRRTFSLAGLYEVVRDWQGRLAHAPAVDAFIASGYDDGDAIDMTELRGKTPPMTGAPYAVRISSQAAKTLDTLPDHVEDTVWDVLDAAAADPWGFRPWNADDPEGEDVRYASVGQLSLAYWVNRPLRRLTVLDIVWLGQQP